MTSRKGNKQKFRNKWNENPFEQRISDEMLEDLFEDVLVLVSDREPNGGQFAKVNVVGGSREVSLPLKFYAEKNVEVLYDIINNRDPLGYKTDHGSLVSRNSLRYPGFGLGIFNPIRQQLSPPIASGQPTQPIPPVIYKTISGVKTPVLMLREPAGTSREVEIEYRAYHENEDAKAVVTVKQQPTDGLTFTISGVVFTYRTAAASSTEITIGGSLAITATNTATVLNSYLSPDQPFSASSSGETFTVSLSDGEEFTIAVDGTKLSSAYTSVVDTFSPRITKHLSDLLFGKCLERLITQNLLEEKDSATIATIAKVAQELIDAALSKIGSRAKNI